MLELNALRRTQYQLTNLLGILGSDVARLQDLIRGPSLHHGLNSIPDEILEKIIRMEIEDTYPHPSNGIAAAIGRLALVSRRFFRIVDSSHAIWSNVTINEGVQPLQRSLQKSGNAPLAISIGNQCNRKTYLSCLRLLDGRMDACAFLFLTEMYGRDANTRRNSTTWNTRKTDTFSSLTELVLFGPVPQSHNFPNLKRLEITVLDIPPRLLSSIIHLRVRLERGAPADEAGGSNPVLDFVASLRSASMLTSLELHNVYLKTDIRNPMQPVSLPRLRMVSLSADERKNEPESSTSRLASLARLSRLLSPVHLHSFHLQLVSSDMKRLVFDEDVMQFFPNSITLEHVREVSFGVHGDICGGPVQQKKRLKAVRADARVFVPTLLEQFFAVETFRLRVSKITDTMDFDSSFLRLRYLYISGDIGSYDTDTITDRSIIVIPRIVDAIKNSLHHLVNLREVIIFLNGNFNPGERPYSWKQLRNSSGTPKVILEQTIGLTNVTVLRRKDPWMRAL